MAIRYTDEEIAALIAERKPLPKDYRSRMQLRQKRGHKEAELEVVSEDGRRFLIKLRQADRNPLDFSVILGYCPADSTLVFRLRRYNGKSHEHSNKIEGDKFYAFHIHEATERYQDFGPKEDFYAQVTERYSDLQGAISCLLEDCGFERPPDSQQSLDFGMKQP